MIVMQAAAWFFPWPFTVLMAILLAALAAAYTLMPGGRHNAPMRDWGADEKPAPREPAPEAIEGAGWAGHYQWRKPQLALPAAETLVTAAHSATWALRFAAEPTGIIKFDGNITEEQAEAFQASIDGWLRNDRGQPEPPAVTVTDDPPAGRHEAPAAHPFTSGGEPYCGKCGKAGHWRGGQSCADAVVDELITRRRDDHVTAAITAHLEEAGFRGHGGNTDAMLDSIIGGIPAVQP